MHVFVSYAKKDTRPLAMEIRDTLEANGISAWMDEELVPAGSWSLQIEEQIKRSDLMIVLLSTDVVRPVTAEQDSSFVIKEIQYAQMQRIEILPIMVHPITMPITIINLQYIDFTQDSSSGMVKLLDFVCHKAGITPLDNAPAPPTPAKPPKSQQQFKDIGDALLQGYTAHVRHLATLDLLDYTPKALAISPDDRILAVTTASNTIQLWDLEQQEVFATILDENLLWLGKIAFAPDGKLLAASTRDHTITLFSMPQGKRVTVLQGQAAQPISLAFSPDSKYLASGTKSKALARFRGKGDVRIWDVQSGQAVKRFDTHNNPAEHVQFIAGGEQLLVLTNTSNMANHTSDVTIWDVKSGKSQRTLHLSEARHLALSADESRFVTSYGYLVSDEYVGSTYYGGAALQSLVDADEVLQVSFKQEPASSAIHGDWVAFTGNDKVMLVSSEVGGFTYAWRVPDMGVLHVFGHKIELLSHDGRRFFFRAGHKIAVWGI